MVTLRSEREIGEMRDAGRIVAMTYATLEEYIRPGVTTAELDRHAESFIRKQGAIPMYKGYHPPGHTRFPATICVAINDQIVHGIPSRKQHLQEGDIIGIDIGVVYRSWIGDACRTYPIGEVDAASHQLVEAARYCLTLGIEQAQPGKRLGDIGAAIQGYAERGQNRPRFSVVRELCGHGVGHALWEEPKIFHHGKAGTGLKLRPGMVFTIEPMINAGRPEIRVESDGWTISTADGSRSAQFEHTIAISSNGPEILTAV